MVNREHTPGGRHRLRVLALGLAGAAVTALALWGTGAVTPRGTQPPIEHPILDPMFSCAQCHHDFATGPDEPFDSWAGSMMANSARDPVFWAALDVAENDVPGVGEFCVRCHVPSGWLAGRSGATSEGAGCRLVGAPDAWGNDLVGVSCHLCHRMMVNETPPPGEDPLYYENAHAWIDDEDCTTPNGGGAGPCRRGPYDYPAAATFLPPHEWAFSQYHVDADICGNCHNVTSPTRTLINPSGSDTGIPFPVERTFLEWQQSDFSGSGGGVTTCQGCHMPDAEADPSYASLQGLFEDQNRVGDMPVHRFVGGNAWVPRLLKSEYGGALDIESEYDQTIAWALDMLQNQSATVQVKAAPADGGEALEVEVAVTNRAGHKLPTGYAEGRRMWLNLTVRDAEGELVFESGAYDPATATLTVDEQAKVYERVNGIWDDAGGTCVHTDEIGRPEFHFVLDDCIVLDNRIPPQGFTGMDDAETRPVGYAYPETAPGSGVLRHWDITSYAVPVEADTLGPLEVEARLYYQTSSREYVEFLKREADEQAFPPDCIRSGETRTRAGVLFDLWEAHDKSPPVEMAAADAEVALPLIFKDGFESGDTSAWSSTQPRSGPAVPQ